MKEKNKEILTAALGKLKSYTPGDEVWEGIESKLNERVLDEALSRLKPIVPPESVWSAIDNELSKKEVLGRLSQYEPPVEVWNRIEESLGEDKIVSISRRKRVFRTIQWVSAIAAMLIFGFFLFKSVISTSTTITYSEEWIETGDISFWEEEDVEVEAVLDELCQENPQACNNPEFKELQEELDFLEQAKREILSQMSEYDENPELEIVLTKIELERTDLIKKMISEVMI